MILTIILINVCFALMFIALGIGANASLKSKASVSLYNMQFALFMAISNFCFYYLGIWISKLLLNMLEIRYIIIALLMIMLSIKTIINHFNYKTEDNFYDLTIFPVRIMLSIAAGINSLLCGIALTLGGFENLKTALLSSVVVFIGALLGAGFKKNLAKKIIKIHPALIGSVLFLLVGIFYILKHFGKVSFYY